MIPKSGDSKMTSARRMTIAWLVAALLLAPALSVFPEVAAEPEALSRQEGGLKWRNVELWTSLYFVSELNPPDAGAPDPNAPPNVQLRGMTTYPAKEQLSEQRSSPQFAITSNGQAPAGVSAPVQAVFSSDALKHEVNVTRNDSLRVTWFGAWQPGLQWIVTVKSTASSLPVGSFTFTDNDANAAKHRVDSGSGVTSGLTTNVPIDKRWENNRFMFKKDAHIRVEIEARSTSPVQNPLGGGDLTGTWQLQLRNPDAQSRLSIRSLDAVKVAGWVTGLSEREHVVKSVFRPNETPPTPPVNRIYAHFAVKSAFGGADVACFNEDCDSGDDDTNVQTKPGTPPTVHRRTIAPTVSFLNVTGVPYGITRDRVGEITLRVDSQNSSARNSQDGTWVYEMPVNIPYWDFTRDLPGEYTAHFSAHFRGDDTDQSATAAATDLTADWKVTISSQALSLRPYDDADPSTQPTPLENLAHDLQSGGTSTYLMLLKNSGAANDTVTLRPTLVSATPTSGWEIRVSGPHVTGDGRIRAEPNKEELVIVTVRAPLNARAGDRAVFTLTPESGLDPSTKLKPQVFSATVSNLIRREVGIVALNDTQEVRGAAHTQLTFYAWNRGTRQANVTIELKDEQTTGWTIGLLDGFGGTQRKLTFVGVPAGDVVRATIDVFVDPGRPPGDSHAVFVNVTSPDGGAGADQRVLFALRTDTNFIVEPLPIIGTDPVHYLEMACWDYIPAYCSNRQAIPEGTSQNDSVDGTWFRLWVTNVGSSEDRYKFSIGSAEETRPDLFENPAQQQRDDAFPTAEGPQLRVFQRNIDGNTRSIPGDGLPIPPGKTAEVYAWVGHEDDSSRYAPTDFSFSVKIESQITKRAKFVTGSAHGSDNEDESVENPETRRNGLKLEAVTRLLDPNLAVNEQPPFVDISQAKKTEINGLVDLGRNVTYHVRVTNGASWKSFTEGTTKTSSDVVLQLSNLDSAKARGWDVKMRKVNGTTNQTKNPFTESLTVSNYNKRLDRYESYRDEEIEIRVTPPLWNSTFRPLAGESIVFTLTGAHTEGIGGVLAFTTTITDLPNVTISAPSLSERIHPGKTTGFVLNLRNNGSSTAHVNLKARVSEQSTSASAWSVSPREQNFDITAHENRSIGILVTAPAGVTTGDQGIVNVTLTYQRNPTDPLSIVNRSVNLQALVRQPTNLKLTAVNTAAAIAPNKVANFTFQVENTASVNQVPYKVSFTPIPNWSQSLSTTGATLNPREKATLVYTALAPSDVIRGRSFWSVLKVQHTSDPDDFDAVPVHVDIIEGIPIPVIELTKSQDLVDRSGIVTFPISLKNFGNAAGNFPLEARVGTGSGFIAWITDAQGKTVTSAQVGPNERKALTLNVQAPANAAEGTIAPVTVSAFSPNDFSVRADATVRVLLHDYAVDVEARPARVDAIPGQGGEFQLKITNVGNGNDTFLLSADLSSVEGWRADFATERVSLLPGGSTTVRLILRTPRDPLPSARPYAFTVIADSTGASAAGLTKTDSGQVTVNVLNFRPFDVDNDGNLELAVDANRRAGDGFERFVEVFNDGVETQFVDNFSGKQDGKIDFLLEVPTDGAYTGIANLYFDPDVLFVAPVTHTPDITGDATPDYLIDTDNDGKIDHAWDTATRKLMRVTVISAFGTPKEQFLVDTDNNGVPDRYHDPDKALVTRVTRETGFAANAVGIDTNGDGLADKYYDTSTRTITNAPLGNVAGFLGSYGYFFALFGAVVVVAVVVLAKRRKRPPVDE